MYGTLGGRELQTFLNEGLEAPNRVAQNINGGDTRENDVEVCGERRAEIEELLQEGADGAVLEDRAAPLNSRGFSKWWCWRLKRGVELVGIVNCWRIQSSVFSEYVAGHGLDVGATSSDPA